MSVQNTSSLHLNVDQNSFATVSNVIKNTSPPIAKKIQTVYEAHNHKRFDDYSWLRYAEDPFTISYLKAWNEHTDSAMEPLSELTNNLYNEFVTRIGTTTKSVPYQLGDYLYYRQMEKDNEHPIHYRKNVLSELVEVVFDANEYAKNFKYFNLRSLKPSPDGKYIALSIDTEGSGRGSILIKEIKTQILLKDAPENSDGQIVWSSSSTGFFYTQNNKELRPDKVCFHEIGKPANEDIMIQSEDDPLYELDIEKDKLNRYLIVTSYSMDTSEVSLYPLSNTLQPRAIVHPREQGLTYYIEMGDNEHYLTVSKNKSNWGLCKLQQENFSKEHWNEVIPSTPSADIISVEVFKNYLAVLKREEGLKRVEIWNLNDKQKHQLKMPQEVGNISFEHNDVFESSYLRFKFDSPVTPPSTYQYNMETHSLELVNQQQAGQFDPNAYTTERIWAEAKDKTQIPISLFYKKGTSRDGTAPFLLFGYGAYGNSSEPRFSNETASLLERGIGFAIAHVRGGSELGRQWYGQGCMKNKMNTFTDFISCAEHLITKQYTSPQHLAIRGRSAGGLLVGAVINMRPELFKACIAEVPFVDVITTMFDESIPLTCQEWEEWGNPNDEEYYRYMMQYSPVDNVTHQNYPSLYVETGIYDNQVRFHEPAKWVAKLLEHKTDQNPLLFRINMDGGHNGPPGRYAKLKKRARVFAFLINQLK